MARPPRLRNRLTFWTTRGIVQDAGRQKGWIKGDLTWERVCDQRTAFDDGLRPRSERQKQP